jgi:DNA-damage-inducible protein J
MKMAVTEQLNVRIEPALKVEAEAILNEIGLGPSDAIRMFYRQVVMRHGLPFEARVVTPRPGKGQKDAGKTRKQVRKFMLDNKDAFEDLSKR